MSLFEHHLASREIAAHSSIDFSMSKTRVVSKMTKLRINLACWPYDRTRPLTDGRVQVEGINLNFLPLEVEETFFRMLRRQEFEACEMSFSSYILSLFTKEKPFIAVPVFTSRMFRHSGIYINSDSGIDNPSDLKGKRVGNPEYQLTACVWIRGILQERYGVPVDSVTYYVGGEEEAGRPEKIRVDVPANIKISSIGQTQTLSSMLEKGDIDAIYSPRPPSPFVSGSKHVKRLFPDFEQEEKKYFQDTQIFPIMHAIVIRRDIYDANPWVATSLYKAFVKAQQLTYRDIAYPPALGVMLPWLPSYLQETKKLMGDDYWPYGVERNKKALEVFLKYSNEQGMAKKILKPDEIFAPETLESFKI
jgi:4,5-dihydroxyphthalate decarboxylase